MVGNELLYVGAYGTSLGNAGAGLYGESGLLPKNGLPGRPKGAPPVQLNIPVLIISAVIFIALVAWFNVLSRLYEDTFDINNQNGYSSTIYALGYAILVTGVAFLIGMITATFM